MPFPNPATQFKKGQSGNPGGRPKRPDIEALDRLIVELDAEPGIAKTWLAEALGSKETIIETEHPDGRITRKIKRERIPANVPLLKLLIEYRNGKVPDRVITETDANSKPEPRIVPRRSDTRRSRRDRRKTDNGDRSGDDAEGTPDRGAGGDG